MRNGGLGLLGTTEKNLNGGKIMLRVERTLVDRNGKGLWVWAVFCDGVVLSYYASKASAEQYKERLEEYGS